MPDQSKPSEQPPPYPGAARPKAARPRIARLVNGFGILLTVGFIVTTLAGVLAIRELKVGGPIYERIVLGKDLVADILPPPEYVIEAYLEATLALDDPASLGAHRARLAQLRKDYDERHVYWLQQDFDTALRDTLTVRSHAEVMRFWDALDRRLLPALAGKDMVAARTAYAEVSAAYNAHRAVIDEVVKRSERFNSDSEAYAAKRETIYMSVVWGVAAAVLALVVAGVLGIARGVIRPVVAMTGVMKTLAEGDLKVAVPADDRRDEVGAMAGAIAIFKRNALETERLRRAQEDERGRAEQEKRAALMRMAETVEREASAAVETVATQTGRMAADATDMAGSAEAVGTNSQNVAAAANEALTNAQTVAAATEELTAAIREIGGQIGTATAITGEAVGASARAEATMLQLVEAVGRIGEVSNLIASIAGQTNLLALNATIEAARAGEMGKGFAVVASEVKNLASQTAKATEDIAHQIAAIQATTQESVDAVRSITGAIRSVESVSAAIATAIEEQGAATGEIARNVTRTASAAQEVAARIAEVSEEAATTGNRAVQVNTLSAELAKSIDRLRHVLVQVVRTAMPEVDRRRMPRYALQAPGTLTLNGRDLPVTVADVSEGGAQLTGPALADPQARAGLMPGVAVTLAIQGMDKRIPGTLKSVGDGAAHLTLAPTPDVIDAFRRRTAGLSPIDRAA